jgi:ABC-type dipeptide/oligopeptide/nickel transport system ATPase component
MLNIENLSVEYDRRGHAIPAVRDFSLTINPDETVGLVGESGSGKSTVALAILRLIRPQEGRLTGGRILFQPRSSPLVGEDEGGRAKTAGNPPSQPSPTRGEGINLLTISDEDMRQVRGRKIAMIFQDPFTSLNPVMRIREQMEETLKAHPNVGADPRVRPQSGSDSISLNSNFGQAQGPAPTILADALTRVQLDPSRTLNSYPHQLSGGQRQRVMMAMALLCRPSLVLADEPTTALDVLVQKEILELLFRLQKEMHMGVLLISHNLALVAQFTRRMVVMKEGRAIEEGDSAQLFKAPKSAYTQELIASLPPMVRGRSSRQN